MTSEINQTVDLLIRNAYAITMDEQRRVYTDGFVAIDGGKIVGVGRSEGCGFQGREEIDASGYVVMPGLINAHNHLVQIHRRGAGDDPSPPGERGTKDIAEAMRWLVHGYILGLRHWADEERTYRMVRLHLLEMLKGGTVATHDQHFTNLPKNSIDGVLRAIDESGMRALVARTIMNDPDMVPEEAHEDLEAGLLEVERLRSRWNSSRIEVVPSPLSLGYVRSGEDVVTLKRGAEAMGSHFEMEIAGNTGVQRVREWGWEGGVGEYLDHLGVLDSSVLGDKGQYVLDREYQLWKDRGVKVCVVPTLPLMFWATGFPVSRFLDAGILPGLGTDSVVTPNASVWGLMRDTLYVQRILDVREGANRPGLSSLLPAETMLEMATRGGAWTLFMDDRTGSLEVGKDADCILVDTRRVYLRPTAENRRLVSNLVLAGETDMVDTVIVAGQVLMRHRECVVWDEEEIIREAEAAMAGNYADTVGGGYLPAREAGQTVRGWTYL